MILFWIICALLAVIALAFILPTLLEGGKNTADGEDEANIEVYRDQISELEADVRNGIVAPEQYQVEREELDRRLLSDVSHTNAPLKKSPKQTTAARGILYAVALGIPVAAVLIYLQIGNQGAIRAATTSQPSVGTTPPGNPQLNEQQRIEANVASLANRLKQNPEDADGWAMLGSSYTALGRFSEASDAYAKATALKTNDAELLADYAFALAMKNGRQLAGEPAELLNKALSLEPDNAKALQLSGSAAFEAKDYKKAVEHWEKLLKRAGPETELGQALSERIAEARRLQATQ